MRIWRVLVETEGRLCCGCRGRIGERGRCLKQTASSCLKRLHARGTAAEALQPREPGFAFPEPLGPAMNCSKPEHGGFLGLDEALSYQAELEDRIYALTACSACPKGPCANGPAPPLQLSTLLSLLAPCVRPGTLSTLSMEAVSSSEQCPSLAVALYPQGASSLQASLSCGRFVPNPGEPFMGTCTQIIARVAQERAGAVGITGQESLLLLCEMCGEVQRERLEQRQKDRPHNTIHLLVLYLMKVTAPGMEINPHLWHCFPYFVYIVITWGSFYYCQVPNLLMLHYFARFIRLMIKIIILK